MMSEPRIRISENLTGLQVALTPDDHFKPGLLAAPHFLASCVAVDNAFMIPLPTPHFAYTLANLPLQPDDVNGLIIGSKTKIAEKTRKKALPEKWRAQFNAYMQQTYPWVPWRESDQLRDPVLRENFIICVSALHELNRLRMQKLTCRALIDFHSRYKLVLLAHNQPGYRKIGSFVALIHQWHDLEKFFIVYREKLMAILQQPAARSNHVNVMMHIQGYFNRQLTTEQRSELCRVIHDYRLGCLSIDSPLSLLKKYLSEYPNAYLLKQQYFTFYPRFSISI